MEVNNMRILLTGATGGIGKALAEQLQKEGAAVLLHGRSQERLNEVFGDDADTVTGDLTQSGDIDDIVRAANRFCVNVLINNAGCGEFERFEQSAISTIINTNVIGTMTLTQAMLSTLKRKPRAVIVNIGSTFGAIGFPGYVAYAASKHAIRGFSESLRRELSSTDVDVLYVSPRATNTSMNSANAREANSKLGVASDTPAQVAAAICAAMQAGRARTQIGLAESLQVRVNAMAPGIVDAAIARQLSTIEQYT